MYKLKTLSNGLTLITVDLPHLDSVTTLVAVGAGSRYETKKVNGISHFLEHMFFKGCKKYPTAEMISTLIDGVGAINNAFTYKEYTSYWIKSAAEHIDLACDILSSEIKESMLARDEIEREKGVIIEELRMTRDNPQRYIWDLYERLQFGDQPLGWDIGGSEKTILGLTRQDFVSYLDSLYSPENMALVFAGNLPKGIIGLSEKYFLNLPQRAKYQFEKFIKQEQKKPIVNIFYKKTDQANVILGIEGYHRYDERRYTAEVLATVLGLGMSSRLFLEVRERRGLAYHISANHYYYKDAGAFTIYGGLKLEKIEEGLRVVLGEVGKIASQKVTEEELVKAKEMIKGHLALRKESTNFLAEYFGTNFVLDEKIETFEELLEKVDKVTKEDLQNVAKDLFQKQKYNLQIIGPLKSAGKFEKILRG